MTGRTILRFALLTLVCGLAACAPCGGAEQAPAPAASEAAIPTGAEAVTVALAEALPGDTDAAFFVRSWATAFERYQAARPRVERVTGDLGFVETDLRNTLSIDLRRAGSLDEIGIASRGGAVAASVGDTAVIITLLRAPDRFVDHATQVLRGAPFALDAEPEVVEFERDRLIVFRRAGRDDAEASIGVRGSLGYLFPAPPADGGRAAFERLRTVGDDALGASDDFLTALRDAGDATYVVHVDGRVASSRAGALAEASGLPAESIRSMLELAGDGTAAIELDAEGLRATWRQRPGDDVVEALRAATDQASAPPFERLMTDDVFALVRLTISADEVVRRARMEDSGAWSASLSEGIGHVDGLFGEGFVDAVLPALGRHAIVMTTRARLITLSRAMNSNAPGEWFNGLGVVVALEVRQRAAVQTALETAVSQLGERATLFEEGGVTVIEFTDADADIGNVVLTDRLLLLVPSRQRGEYVSQLRTGEGASMSGVEALGGAALVRDASVQGLFIDVQQVVNGPIGSVALARLPDEARAALSQFDRIVVDVRLDGDVVVADATLQFAPLAEP